MANPKQLGLLHVNFFFFSFLFFSGTGPSIDTQWEHGLHSSPGKTHLFIYLFYIYIYHYYEFYKLYTVILHKIQFSPVIITFYLFLKFLFLISIH